MGNFQYDFFMSRIEHVRDIKENDKIKISLVLYEGIQGPCIFKICKNRNLLDVCANLKDIRHPNIVVIYDYLYADNNTYIIEEYIEGSTIKELLEQNGCFSEKNTVRIMQEVCNGLEILHKKTPPIVHNDVNTSNIMVRQDGSVKIFDFDISRTYKEGIKQNTRLFGTEEYAAPEHYGYGQSEPRTDIYSLGVTMHEMLTGKKLNDQHKVTYKGKLQKIITKCTQIDPQKRYSSVTNLKRELKKKLKKTYGIVWILLIVALVFILIILTMGACVSGLAQTLDEMRQSIDMTSLQQLNNSVTEQNNEEVVKTSSEQEEYSNMDYIQETEEENTEESLVIESESIVTPSKMSTVCEISGLLKSMVSLNDGTIVYLEQREGYYYLKDSLGQENLLNNLTNSGCKLGYDGYKDALYLFEDYDGALNIYAIDAELNKEKLALIRYTSEGRDISEEFWDVRFYSDGVVDISSHIPLIDTNTWMVVAQSKEYDAVINDCMYNIYLEPEDEQYGFICEKNVYDENIREYHIPESIQTQSLYKIPGYQNSNMFYFLGSDGDKYNVYGFDGNTITKITCLNDYRYYSELLVGDWCVTKEKIWIYDLSTYTIKEFPLN